MCIYIYTCVYVGGPYGNNGGRLPFAGPEELSLNGSTGQGKEGGEKSGHAVPNLTGCVAGVSKVRESDQGVALCLWTYWWFA